MLEVALINKYLAQILIKEEVKGKFIEFVNLFSKDYLSTLGLFEVVDIEILKDSIKFLDDVESEEIVDNKSYLLFKLLDSFASYYFANVEMISEEKNIMPMQVEMQSKQGISNSIISCYIHNLIVVNNKKSEFIKFMNSNEPQNFRTLNGFSEIKNINLLNDGFQNTFYIEDNNGFSKSFLTSQYEIVKVFKGFANAIFEIGGDSCSV